jgi:hypothetical protein
VQLRRKEQGRRKGKNDEADGAHGQGNWSRTIRFATPRAC